jgi:hypothetical protein
LEQRLMERLLLLRLEAVGCAAEAQVNGLPVARTTAQGGRHVVAVHEYTLGGDNRLALVIGPRMLPGAPASEPCIAMPGMRATLHLALARQGQSVTDPDARLLASKQWLPKEGDAFDAPLELSIDVQLPVTFPRWRWLDAPPVPHSAATDRLAIEFVQRLAVDFARGDPQRYLDAARIRFEELALAYQCAVPDLIQRFRDRLQALYAAKALVIVPPAAAELQMRRVAGARLIECLGADGHAALRTAPAADASVTAWPLRLAVVEDKLYVLR